MLLQILNQLHQRVAMYLGFQELALNYQQRSSDEHWQLLTQLEQGDVPAAVALLHQHIAEAGMLLKQHLAKEPV